MDDHGFIWMDDHGIIWMIRVMNCQDVCVTVDIMGATTSSLADLAQNEYLMRLSGRDPIDPMDPFWNQLLSFSFLIPVNRYAASSNHYN